MTPDQQAIASSCRRNPKHSAIAVTQGIQHHLSMREREYRADLTGAERLGHSEPLAQAFENLQRGAQRTPSQVNPADAPMCIVNPFSALNSRAVSRLFSTHPPMEDRIRRLGAVGPVLTAQTTEVDV